MLIFNLSSSFIFIIIIIVIIIIIINIIFIISCRTSNSSINSVLVVFVTIIIIITIIKIVVYHLECKMVSLTIQPSVRLQKSRLLQEQQMVDWTKEGIGKQG